MWPESRYLALLFGFALFCVAESVLFGPHSYTPLHDEANSALPFRFISALDALGGGSDWMPWMGMGTDRRATMMDPDLDTVIYSLLPIWAAYGLNKLLVPLAAGVGLFLYAIRRFQAAPMAAMIGACFLITNPWVYFEKFAIALFPLMMLWIGWARERHGWKSPALLAALGGLYGLVSMPVYSAWGMVAFALIPWLLERVPLRKALLGGLPLLAGYMLVEGKTFAAIVLNGPYSTRQFEAAQFDWNSYSLLSYLPPRLWFPLLIAAAVPLAGVTGRLRRDGLLVRIGLIAGVCVVAPAAWGLLTAVLGSHFSFLRAGSVRVGHDVAVWIALGAALALGPVLDAAGRGRRPIIALLLAGLFLPVAAKKSTSIWEAIHGFTVENLFRHPELVGFRAATAAEIPFRVATPFYLGPDGHLEPVFTAAHGFEAVDGHLNFYSQRYKEFWTQVIGRLETLNPARYGEFIRWGHRIYLFGVPTEWGDDCPGAANDCPVRFAEAFSLPLLSLANVRYVITNRPLTDTGLELMPSASRDELLSYRDMRMREKLLLRLKGRYVGQPLYIYHNISAFERVFLAHRVKRFVTKEALLAALGSATVDDLRQAVYVRDGDVPDNIDKEESVSPESTAHITGYDAERISVVVNAKAAEILVVSNNYSPFWRAAIDGRPAKVFPANHTMLGVVVPPGQHEINLFYSPPYSYKSSP